MGGMQYTNIIESREFKDFISDAGLIDFGYFRSRFTWCNNWLGATKVWKMIDQVLATTGWLQQFSWHQVQYLPRIALDTARFSLPQMVRTCPGLHFNLRSFELSIQDCGI